MKSSWLRTALELANQVNRENRGDASRVFLRPFMTHPNPYRVSGTAPFDIPSPPAMQAAGADENCITYWVNGEDTVPGNNSGIRYKKRHLSVNPYESCQAKTAICYEIRNCAPPRIHQ